MSWLKQSANSSLSCTHTHTPNCCKLLRKTDTRAKTINILKIGVWNFPISLTHASNRFQNGWALVTNYVRGTDSILEFLSTLSQKERERESNKFCFHNSIQIVSVIFCTTYCHCVAVIYGWKNWKWMWTKSHKNEINRWRCGGANVCLWHVRWYSVNLCMPHSSAWNNSH